MPVSDLNEHIIRTLLYYEIFDHPLSEKELFYLLPKNSLTRTTFRVSLEEMLEQGTLARTVGFFHLPSKESNGTKRIERQQLAKKRILIARFITHIIKRFPFVRGVFISGDLSKGVATPSSDIDYVIITEPRRVWICRTILMLFKKVFLLNSKKYFCLNYYVDANNLSLDERNYYTATEIAHLKPVYNLPLFLKYLNANNWILEYFPNYRNSPFHTNGVNNRQSAFQKLFEMVFQGSWADRFDNFLMETMKRTWKKRYPEYSDETRENIFKCTVHESRAYGGNFAGKVLSMYDTKLSEHHLNT